MKDVCRRLQAVLQFLHKISPPLPIPRYRTHSLLFCRLSCGRGPDPTDSQVLPGSRAEPAAIPWSPRPTGPVISSDSEEGSRRHQPGAFDSGRCTKDEVAHNHPNPCPDPQYTVPATRTRERPRMSHCCHSIFRLFRLGELLVESPAHMAILLYISESVWSQE